MNEYFKAAVIVISKEIWYAIKRIIKLFIGVVLGFIVLGIITTVAMIVFAAIGYVGYIIVEEPISINNEKLATLALIGVFISLFGLTIFFVIFELFFSFIPWVKDNYIDLKNKVIDKKAMKCKE